MQNKNFYILSITILTTFLLALTFSFTNVFALQGADFAIYSGSGTWEPSKTAFKNFLEWKGLTWEEVNKNDINRKRLIGKYQGLFMPGGWAGDYNRDIKSAGDQHIRDFINQGGAYIGMSAGAFYACDVTIWEGDVLDYPSNIFDGDCIGPIEEIAPWPEYTMTTMSIDSSHEANIYEPAQRDTLYYGEPYFVPHSGQEMLTLASWIVPSNPVANGAPGIISFNYGQGRVVLVGPHPEIEEDELRDGTNFAEELSDGPDGSDWPFLWTAVDWLFKNPITLPPGTHPKQCADGLDNDLDGLIDLNDPGCLSLSDDDDETDPLPPQCSDAIDNDFDGFIDFPADLGCTSPNDNDETDPIPTQCSDSIDNDLDGLIDLNDPGCLSLSDDDDETDPTGPVEIFADTFESASLSKWATYGQGRPWIASQDQSFEGNWAARAKRTGAGDDSFIETTINASAYNKITFEYQRKLISLDTADDWEVQYFDSASNTWNSVEHLGSGRENNANFVFKSHTIPNTASKIRFKCECGAVSEKCYVDNVKILGE
jgi:glutamine amidotransferase-like uncharacterized protein